MSKSKSKKKINNYVIFLEEPLGSGAYATVYKARDEQSNTPYAVKVIQRAKSTNIMMKWKPTPTQPKQSNYRYQSTNPSSTPTSSEWPISYKPPTTTISSKNIAVEATFVMYQIIYSATYRTAIP